MSSLLSTYGFPSVFSHLVAQASMTLPPMKSEDGEFLSGMMGSAVNTFLENYVSLCSEEEQAEIRSALEQNDGDAMVRWFETRADFLSEGPAKERAEQVLRELERKLPAVMAEEYQLWIAQKNTNTDYEDPPTS